MSNIEYKTDLAKKYPKVTISVVSKMPYAQKHNRDRKIFTDGVQNTKYKVISKAIQLSKETNIPFENCINAAAQQIMLRYIKEVNLDNMSPWDKGLELTDSQRRTMSSFMQKQSKIGKLSGNLRYSTHIRVSK